MKIINTKFAGLKVIQNFTFLDKRGYFKELIVEKKIKKKFPFNVMSFSKKNVLRGMHLQTKKSQGKYISVIKGEILDVVIDLRKNSKTFKKQFISRLSEKNSKSIFIPPGFAHGFYTIAKENYIIYSCTNYRSKTHEISLNWKDEDLDIAWPCKKPIISKKDNEGMTLKKLLHLLK
jgi:dTDP-4-dehydrorhamnose 3,5-epimerase|tara:strand:- start:2346 stop:2873 length:528 start_codon:yes stop_codon:yes gene_type:complete